MATVCIILGFVVMGLVLNAFELLACHTGDYHEAYLDSEGY